MANDTRKLFQALVLPFEFLFSLSLFGDVVENHDGFLKVSNGSDFRPRQFVHTCSVTGINFDHRLLVGGRGEQTFSSCLARQYLVNSAPDLGGASTESSGSLVTIHDPLVGINDKDRLVEGAKKMVASHWGRCKQIMSVKDTDE